VRGWRKGRSQGTIQFANLGDILPNSSELVVPKKSGKECCCIFELAGTPKISALALSVLNRTQKSRSISLRLFLTRIWKSDLSSRSGSCYSKLSLGFRI
jgi:hypothetical protein